MARQGIYCAKCGNFYFPGSFVESGRCRECGCTRKGKKGLQGMSKLEHQIMEGQRLADERARNPWARGLK